MVKMGNEEIITMILMCPQQWAVNVRRWRYVCPLVGLRSVAVGERLDESKEEVKLVS